jgi:hypothetical protein
VETLENPARPVICYEKYRRLHEHAGWIVGCGELFLKTNLRGKNESCTNLTVVRAITRRNHATLCREMGSWSFAAGLVAGKMAVIVVPKALESTVNSP